MLWDLFLFFLSANELIFRLFLQLYLRQWKLFLVSNLLFFETNKQTKNIFLRRLSFYIWLLQLDQRSQHQWGHCPPDTIILREQPRKLDEGMRRDKAHRMKNRQASTSSCVKKLYSALCSTMILTYFIYICRFLHLLHCPQKDDLFIHVHVFDCISLALFTD